MFRDNTPIGIQQTSLPSPSISLMMLQLVFSDVLCLTTDKLRVYQFSPSHLQASCNPNVTFFPLIQEKQADSLNHTKVLMMYILFLSNHLQFEKKEKNLESLILTSKGLIFNDGISGFVVHGNEHALRQKQDIHWGKKKTRMASSHPYYIPPILYVSVIHYARFHTQLSKGKFTNTQNLEWLCGQIHLRNTDLCNCSIQCIKIKRLGQNAGRIILYSCVQILISK